MKVDDDPFSRLDLPRRFNLTEATILGRRRERLALVHPDLEPDPVQRALAMRESAAISAAARTLLDPVLRAELLLRESGVDPAPTPPPAILIEMLEWRERLDSLLTAGDHAAIEVEWSRIDERIAALLTALATEIDDTPGTSRASQSGGHLSELRLLRRLREQTSSDA